jgi:hypothetical protein
MLKSQLKDRVQRVRDIYVWPLKILIAVLVVLTMIFVSDLLENSAIGVIVGIFAGLAMATFLTHFKYEWAQDKYVKLVLGEDKKRERDNKIIADESGLGLDGWTAPYGIGTPYRWVNMPFKQTDKDKEMLSRAANQYYDQ